MNKGDYALYYSEKQADVIHSQGAQVGVVSIGGTPLFWTETCTPLHFIPWHEYQPRDLSAQPPKDQLTSHWDDAICLLRGEEKDFTILVGGNNELTKAGAALCKSLGIDESSDAVRTIAQKPSAAVFAEQPPSSAPANNHSKKPLIAITALSGISILFTSAILFMQMRKSEPAKTPPAIKTTQTSPAKAHHKPTTDTEIRRLLDNGTFDHMRVVAGHHIKKELLKAVDQGDARLVTARVADAGFEYFNGAGHNNTTRQVGAELYFLAARNATEHDLHNRNSKSAQRSVEWLKTTQYKKALEAK